MHTPPRRYKLDEAAGCKLEKSPHLMLCFAVVKFSELHAND